jgi:hypothetical protein
MNLGRSRLAAYVALAYTLVIVYASLQPFAGWRMPPVAVFGFLTAAWPRYITSGDIFLNIAAYLPLGAMLVIALRPRCAGINGCLVATALAAVLSAALESVQLFLPVRIASNLDLLANTGGAALGALGAWLLDLPLLARHPLVVLRQRVIRADTLGDCGLIALAVWLFIQFDPAPLALASGDLRELFGFKPWINYAPAAYRSAEMCIAALAALTLGLIAAQIATTRGTAALAGALALTLAFICKSVSVWALTRATNPFQWLTPGVMGGLLIGVAALTLAIWLSQFWRSLLAIVCLFTSVILVNVMPENPYQTTPPFLLASPPTHLSSFSNILRLLSQLWPFATAVLLFRLARNNRDRAATKELTE